MRRDVRVLLVGDEGVGKSTIITSFLKRSFVENIPRVIPEVTIPDCLDGVTATVVDSSPRPADRPHLDSELRKAHVIVIVYSIDQPGSFDRLAAWWLPYIRGQGVNVPVILCGNKIDKRDGEVTAADLQLEVLPIMSEFKEVEACVECSARLLSNVTEVIFFALKAVCYPLAPLYDSREHTLKPKCVDALRRIFKLCDVNKDGVLDPAELNEFQRKCFSSPLQLQEIDGLTRLIADHDASMVSENGINEAGILYFHTRFIQQGRVDTIWIVLTSFGYGEDLELREEILRPRFDVSYDCSVELSPSGYQFLTEIFEIFDKDQDGALSESELEALFSTSPGNPWAGTGFPDTTVTTGGKVTLQGWLSQWSLTTLLDHRTTLSYLCYLGYSSYPSSLDRPTTTALHLTRSRKADRKAGKVTRNVFNVYVLGAAGAGKTSLLRAFVGKGFEEEWSSTEGKGRAVVNGVERGGGEKYLVLQEFGSKYESETLRSSKKLDLADVIVYVFDSSDTNSFSYISNLRQQYKLNHIPCIFVATKSDLDLAQQRHEVQPDVYAKRLGLQVPISVSVREGQTADLWLAICRVAMNPQSAIPNSPSSSLSTVVPVVPLTIATLSALLAGSFFALRWYRLIGTTTGTTTGGGTTGHWAGVFAKWLVALSGVTGAREP